MGDIFSEDRLLGGRVILRQPVQGFRAAIDPILLAASISASAGQRVLELGSGTGAAALCLAIRLPGLSVRGLEAQPDLAALANENAALNGLDSRVRFSAGRIEAPPPDLLQASVDHVMANPPYLKAGTATPPPDAARAMAVGEGAVDLAAWVAAALGFVRPRGSVTFIHRADRLAPLLTTLSAQAGEIVVFPLWPCLGKPAKRVLIRARRAIQTPLRLSPGLVLHGPDQRFTPEAEAVLRDGVALTL